MNKLYISNVKNVKIYLNKMSNTKKKKKKDTEISVIKHKCQNLKS